MRGWAVSETLRRVQTLVLSGEVRVSDHGYGELEKDQISIEDIITGIISAERSRIIESERVARAC